VRFALIEGAKAEFPVHRLCRVLGVSQSGYFAWRGRPACRRQRDDMVLLAHVRSAFALSNGTYGSPRMTRELQDAGLVVGRRRVARLMRDNGLQARQKRRFKRTTDSHHAWPVAPNLLDQDFTATGPDQKWGADISYVWTREGWLYLAVVIDLFARRVVGWATGDRLHRDLALAALRKALTMRRPAAGLIHHSDRGSQYCSIDYQAELNKHGILVSMSGKGNCYDNAMVETFFKTLKSLQDPEIRARLADRLPHPPTSGPSYWPLHRWVLQSRPAPFRPRFHKPGSVRKTCRRMSQCLSTKARQVQ
jgi:putative transposase